MEKLNVVLGVAFGAIALTAIPFGLASYVYFPSTAAALIGLVGIACVIGFVAMIGGQS